MTQYHRFTIGDNKMTSLYDGEQEIAISKLFPTLNKNNNLYNQKLVMGFNLLHIEHSDGNILVDSGRGKGSLLESLKLTGIDINTIDKILITHCDGDHIGGISKFPNAEIYMPEDMYNLWTSEEGLKIVIEEFEAAMKNVFPEERMQMKLESRKAFSKKLSTELKPKIKLVAVGEEFIPGIIYHEAKGHRSDHYAIEITSQNETLIHIADAMRHKVQFEGYHSIFDSHPNKTMQTIRSLFDLAKSRKAIVYGSHLTFPGLMKS